MSEMIERVAKAIYEEDDPWHKAWPWPDLNEKQGSADAYRRIAAAAIKAMHEPTPDMVASGVNQALNGVRPIGFSVKDYVAELHGAMIDAALVGEVG